MSILNAVEPASCTRLVDPEVVRKQASLPDDETGASEAALLADQVSAMAVTYTDREFAVEVVEEYVQGGGTPRLMLSRWPVVEVLEVESTDGAIIPNYMVDKKRGMLVSTEGPFKDGSMLGRDITTHRRAGGLGAPNYRVKYRAGYALPCMEAPETEGAPPLPMDLQQALVSAAVTLWQWRGRDSSLVSESIGDWSWTRGAMATTGMTGVPAEFRGVVGILNKYAQVV